VRSVAYVSGATFVAVPWVAGKEHPKARTHKEVSTMTDDELRGHVCDELAWDPKIDSSEVAVAAKDGVVTLRGSVGSFRQKREAGKASERVRGVIDVNNQLEVRILTEQRREDAEVRGDVLQALLLDAHLPTSVDATVKNGSVTLTGAVDWEYQRNEAIFIAGNVLGVAGVDDQIYLNRHTPSAGDVRSAIEKAFLRDARLDAQRLTVATSSGTVTLTGTVRSWPERDAAVAAAWAAPGVRTVNDRITVTT
jgi:osmotically-inducible protein OsmY